MGCLSPFTANARWFSLRGFLPPLEGVKNCSDSGQDCLIRPRAVWPDVNLGDIKNGFFFVLFFFFFFLGIEHHDILINEVVTASTIKMVITWHWTSFLRRIFCQWCDMRVFWHWSHQRLNHLPQWSLENSCDDSPQRLDHVCLIIER